MVTVSNLDKQDIASINEAGISAVTDLATKAITQLINMSEDTILNVPKTAKDVEGLYDTIDRIIINRVSTKLGIQG